MSDDRLSELRSKLQSLSPAELAALRASAQLSRQRSGEADAAPFPLSFAQEGVWALSRLNPGSAVNNNAAVIRIKGELDLERLAAAVRSLQQEQASLRIRIRLVEGIPQQSPADGAEELSVIDLARGMMPGGAPNFESTGLQIARNFARKPFDLEGGALFRAQLVRTSPALSFLTLVMHHIISDGWSWGVVLSGLSRTYDAGGAPTPAPAPAPAPAMAAPETSFRRFVMDQHRQFESGAWEESAHYWRESLQASPPFLDIPTSAPRTGKPSAGGARFNFALSPDLSAGIAAMTRTRGITPFVVFYSALSVLMRRLCAENDVKLAAPFANRTTKANEGLVGLFLNTVLLRMKMGADQTYADVLDTARNVVHNAMAHQHYPLEKVSGIGGGGRPAFQLMLIENNAAGDEFHLGNLSCKWLPTDIESAKCELSLFFWKLKGSYVFFWEYNKDLFDHTTITKFTREFIGIMESLVFYPERKLGATDRDHAPETIAFNAGNVGDMPRGLRSGDDGTADEDVDLAALGRRRSEVPVQSSIDDWVYRPVWERMPAPAMDGAGPSGQRILLFRPDDEFGAALLGRLLDAGMSVVDVVPGAAFAQTASGYAIDPAQEDVYVRLCAALTQRGFVPERVIHSWAASPGRNPAPESLHERISAVAHAQSRGLLSVMSLAAQMVRLLKTGPLAFDVIAHGLAPRVDGVRAMSDHGGLIGALAVLGQEFKGVRARLLNLSPEGRAGEWAREWAREWADLILAAVRDGTQEDFTAYDANGDRYVRRYVRHAFTSDELIKSDRFSWVRPGGFYVIFGGLGGIGLALARYAAEHGAGRLILAGRRPPGPDAQSWIAMLRDMGTQVDVHEIDVSDPEALLAFDERVLTGAVPDTVIHAAGVEGTGMIVRKSRAETLANLAAKVDGTVALHWLCGKRGVRNLLIFGSVSASLGGVGLSDYAAANAFLDAFTDARAGDTAPRVITVDWGPWRDVGMLSKAGVPADHLTVHRMSLERALPADRAFAVLNRMLASRESRLIICAQDYDALWRIGRGADAILPQPARQAEKRLSDIEAAIVQIWSMVLGVSSVAPGDHFFDDHGGHSLLAFQAVERIGAKLGREIPLTLLYDNPILSDFCAAVKEETA